MPPIENEVKLTESAHSFTHNRLEYPCKWFGQLVVQVIAGINGNIIFEDEERVFCFLVCSSGLGLGVSLYFRIRSVTRTFGTLDYDIRHPVTGCRSRTRIALTHPFCQLVVGLLPLVYYNEGFHSFAHGQFSESLTFFGQSFSDH